MNLYFKNIRIISGILKGRVIRTIPVAILRPTLNKIKETLFNWLITIIPDAECLDCFAGSGALSIESISRSAKHVTALESNKKIFDNLTYNIIKLNIKNITIIHTNTLFWLKTQFYKYDIIFLDPPYSSQTLQKAIWLIEKNKLIKKLGYIYVETNKNQKIQYPKNWKLCKNKYNNDINYKLYISI